MRRVDKYRYVVALFLTVAVFLMGIMFSNLIDQQRSDSLDRGIENDLIELESNQLQISYLQSGEIESCEALQAGLSNIVSGYNQRLEHVQSFQEDSVFNSQEFENIKRRYILSGIRYWIFAEELRERCDYSPNTILFFTSTLENDCAGCKETGRELSLLKKRYGEQILIFSIPVEMEDGMTSVIANKYNITRVPSVVVNGNRTMVGPRSRGDLEEHLNFSTAGGEE